jgi:hypothetical protein
METYQIIMVCIGLIAFFVACANWAIGRRAHYLNVYTEIFKLFDYPEMRAARSYVYKLRSKDDIDIAKITTLMKDEHWSDINFDTLKDDPNFSIWKEHRDLIEKVVRSFDQLGLLVREGKVPINLLAQFYASPALRCWFSLTLYVDDVREVRKQKGHLWEWENLIKSVVIPGLNKDKGVWKGIKAHDELQKYIDKFEYEWPRMKNRDLNYKPSSHIWEIGRIWDFRKW